MLGLNGITHLQKKLLEEGLNLLNPRATQSMNRVAVKTMSLLGLGLVGPANFQVF
jgi:hypothetical protein